MAGPAYGYRFASRWLLALNFEEPMTTDEREAIYEHCAKLAERRAEKASQIGECALLALAKVIREHAQEPVRYP